MHFSLEPEVAGGFGENTIIDHTTHPPDVKRLHYELDGWLGDDLLESFPCYIVTDRIKIAIDDVAETGFDFDDVEITTSEQFHELYSDREIPTFWWLKVSGEAGVDDFGISADNCLVVSERVLSAVRENGILLNCEITDCL